MVLDCFAKAVERLYSVFHESRQQVVGEFKAIRVRIGGIAREIGEDAGYIAVHAAAKIAARVVRTGIGNAGLLQIMKHAVINAGERRLTHAVHGTHAAERAVKIDMKLCHENAPF